MKINILFGRPCLGDHRQEVAHALIDATMVAHLDARVDDLIHVPIIRVPVSVARNRLVQEARERQCDILFMVDSDMWPAEGFFKFALDFLLNHDGPAAIGSPYVMGCPRERVNVFEFVSDRSSPEGQPPNSGIGVDNVSRNDAALRTGVERVANVGTGYIAYKLTCFDKIQHPYFEYAYEDETHTKVVETEDCWAHRRMVEANVPLYVSWDHWSRHHKSYWAEKPVKLQLNEPSRYWFELAKEQVRAEMARG